MGCVRGHAEPCAWYHHYHVPRPRRGGFRTRPYGTRIHGTRIQGTRPYGTFITICTQGRMCIFGEIVNGVMHLNEAGHIVAWTWQDLPNHVPNGIWDAFVVMPNHVHGTIIITSRPASKRPKPTKSKPINKGDKMELHFLKVGNGDCTIIKLPNGNLMMVDICNGRGEDPKLTDPVDYVSRLTPKGQNQNSLFMSRRTPTWIIWTAWQF
jgi:hypothetical protein